MARNRSRPGTTLIGPLYSRPIPTVGGTPTIVPTSVISNVPARRRRPIPEMPASTPSGPTTGTSKGRIAKHVIPVTPTEEPNNK
jgi:hypothetical protein